MPRLTGLVPGPETFVDIDDAEGGARGAREMVDRPRRRPAPRLVRDGLAAVRLESARLGLSRTAVSARFREQVAWTLDEIGLLAQLFGCRVVDLVSEAPDRNGRSVW
jgi:hypothetical protein